MKRFGTVMLSILAAITTAAAVFGAIAAPSPEKVRQAAGEVLEDPAVQTELPGAPAPQGISRRGDHASADLPGPISPLAQGIGQVLLFAILIGVVIALVMWLFGRARAGRDPLSTREATTGDPRGDPDEREQDLDPDYLARERKFREAIRALLSKALALAWPRGDVPAALTNREVVQTVDIAPPSREALATLVAAAEVYEFSPGAVTAADYDRVTDLYRAFCNAKDARGQRS